MKRFSFLLLALALAVSLVLTAALASCGGGDNSTPGSNAAPGGSPPGSNSPSGSFDPNRVIGTWAKDGSPGTTLTFMDYVPGRFVSRWGVLGKISVYRNYEVINGVIYSGGTKFVRTNGIFSVNVDEDYSKTPDNFLAAFEGEKLRIAEWANRAEFVGLYTRQ